MKIDVNQQLLAALKHCHAVFDQYIEHHLKKPDYDKAAANEHHRKVCAVAIAAAEVAQPVEYVTVQEAWLAAGGNPGISASKEELISALHAMDEAIDDSETAKQPASAQTLSDAELGDLIVSIADSNGFDTKDPAGVDELCRAVARAIEARPASAQPVAVPDGYALTPIKPTHAMLDAAVIAGDEPGSDYYTIYQAMLSAAQKP